MGVGTSTQEEMVEAPVGLGAKERGGNINIGAMALLKVGGGGPHLWAKGIGEV